MTTGRRLGIGATCGLLLLVAAAPITFGATRTFDFDNDTGVFTPYGVPDENCANPRRPPLFNYPGYSTQTAPFIVMDDGAGTSWFGCGHGTFGGDFGNDAALTHYFYYDTVSDNDSNSQELRFSWVDPTDDTSWVRVITAAAGSTAPLFPNPTVHIGDGSKVTMKFLVYLLDGSGIESTSGQIEVALILRETGKNLPLGEDGSADVGNLEFVGVDGSSTAGLTAPYTPIGGVTLTDGGGALTDWQGYAWYTVEWLFGSDNTKVTVTVDGGTPQTLDIAPCINGDGVLTAANDRCTLAALAIRKPASDDVTKQLFIDIDDIVIEAPGVTDPVAIQAPVLEYVDEVTVKFIDPSAQSVKLYKDTGSGPVLEATALSTDVGVDFSDGEHTFSGLSLDAGDILTATQTIGGVEGSQSSGVPVLSAVVWSDNFDGYADQAAFDAVWLPTTGNVDFELASDEAASCPNTAKESAAATGTDPYRRYVDLVTVAGVTDINGTDDVPLWLTWYFRHGNSTGQRNYIQFNSYTGNVYTPGVTTLTHQYFVGCYNEYAPLTNYQVRDNYDGGPNWFVLDAPRQNNTWVKMQIKLTSSATQYFINDTEVFAINPLLNPMPRYGNDPVTTIILGSGSSNAGIPAWFDNISVSLGPTATDPFGPPLPVPTVAGPLTPDVNPTTVTVNGLSVDATQVNVFSDGALIGSESLSGETTKVVSVSSIPNKTRITATQVLPEGESCRSNSAGVLAAYPAPVVSSPINGGSVTVTVTNIDPNATAVTVYVNGSPVLPATSVSGESSVVITVPALVDDDLVWATQTINGFESLPSAAVRVYTQGVGTLLLALGVRESSGISGPVGAAGTAAGGIEWLGYTKPTLSPGGHALVPGGGWQQVTFDPAVDLVRDFASGDGILNGPSAPWYTLENIAFTIDQTNPKRGPYTLYIDDITSGGVTFGNFEAYTPPTANGSVMFRQPTYSGSSSNMALTPNLASVTNEQAHTGNNSLKVQWAWDSDLLTSWLRLTTNNVANQGNPQINLSSPVTMWMLLCGAPEVFVGNILVDGGDTVSVTGVNPAADSVQVYADGNPTPIGSAAGNGTDIVNVTGLSLTTGQVITVTQTVGGAEGCVGATVTVGDCAQVSAVSVTGPLVNLDDEVTVTGIDSNAQQVSVYVVGNPTAIGTTSAGWTDTISVPLTTSLSAGQVIVATQTLEGLEGCVPASGPVVGSGANGALRIALGIREPDPPTGDDLEWVGASGTPGGPVAPTQVITPNSGWQMLTFDSTSLVQEFNGNGVVTPNVNGVVRIDHLAIIRDAGNTDTGPYVLYIDEIKNGSTTLQGFETAPPGSEVWFQEPTFSGTTDMFILSQPNVAQVDASQADVGNQSYRTEWQFVDGGSGRWLRLVTSGAPLQDISVDLTQGVTLRVLLLPASTCNDPVQDTDGDGDVDLTDFGVFSQCFNGPNRAYAALLPEVLAKCECLDQDGDSDVDLTDFGVFSSCFNGPNRPPAAGCP